MLVSEGAKSAADKIDARILIVNLVKTQCAQALMEGENTQHSSKPAFCARCRMNSWGGLLLYQLLAEVGMLVKQEPLSSCDRFESRPLRIVAFLTRKWN